MPVSPATTRLLAPAERAALRDALAAARRHEAEALQAEAVAHAKEAGWKGALGPLRATAASDGNGDSKGSGAGGQAALEAHMAAEAGGAQPRTLAEDWASLKLALKAPVVWAGGCWRLFYVSPGWRAWWGCEGCTRAQQAGRMTPRIPLDSSTTHLC